MLAFDAFVRQPRYHVRSIFEDDEAMPSSVKEMPVEANAAVPRLNPAEIRDMIGKGNALIVDVRDAPELAGGGQLKGAVHVSCGMLESRADPDSRFHDPAFQRDRRSLSTVPRGLLCASGGRSALSGKTLKDLGYQSVFNADDVKELAGAGLDTEPG
jgi:rhodanese-related sulfurtransferase